MVVGAKKLYMTSSTGKKGSGGGFFRAIVDLFILVLMLGAAGFGGYFWGVHQQLAPVLKVPLGTPGAILPSQTTAAKTETPASTQPAKEPEPSTTQASTTEKPVGKKKFWISSTGTDYIGYSITVKVNGTPVDSFFGPGKNIDITHLVKRGNNKINFEAKNLGEQYNKHDGEANADLVLKVVSGPILTDSFKASDVIVSYKRKATESDDFNDTEQFSGE